MNPNNEDIVTEPDEETELLEKLQQKYFMNKDPTKTNTTTKGNNNTKGEMVKIHVKAKSKQIEKEESKEDAKERELL